jgi:hypothetical protein
MRFLAGYGEYASSIMNMKTSGPSCGQCINQDPTLSRAGDAALDNMDILHLLLVYSEDAKHTLHVQQSVVFVPLKRVY